MLLTRINKANTWIFSGADIGSNHGLVMKTFKLRLKTTCCSKDSHIHFDLENLKDAEVTRLFQIKFGSKFTALNHNSDVDTSADHIKEVLLTTAEEVLGKW